MTVITITGLRCSSQMQLPKELRHSLIFPLYSHKLYRRNVRLSVAFQASAFPSATCMEDIYDQLALKALKDSDLKPPGSKHIVGVAGVPGSGKSTLAAEVCRRINQIRGSSIAVQVPMDGFHYYRWQLDQMPDPQEAHARRGAHWTFDAAAYVDCLHTIKTQGAALAPSFDHGVGDPRGDDISVTAAHTIIVSEGNYLLLDLEPWSDLLSRGILDDSWFVECEVDVAMQRVYERQTGNGLTGEVSQRRIATNDRPNAEEIDQTKNRAALVVPLLPFCASEE